MVPTATNAAFAFGTGDFSIELWTYLPSVSAYGRLFTSSANNSNMDFAAGGAITYYDGGSYSAGTLVANAWQHILVTRQSGTLRTFLNGVMQANAANSTNISSAAQYAFAAATNGANTTLQYMAGIRVVKGGIPSAYVTSSTTNGTKIFNPPTAAFTGSESLTAGSVSLLLNFTNAGIFDQTGKNVLETVGNAQISTSVKKYGSGSLAFDGTGDYLDIQQITNVQFGAGDFTIEGWLYLNSLSAAQALIDFRASNGASYGEIYIATNGTLHYYLPTDVATTNSFSTGTWTHFAITRSSGTLNMYINGTRGYSATQSGAMDASKFRIGADVSGSAGLNGYIDDLRITKGFARYSGATLTVPTAAFEDR